MKRPPLKQTLSLLMVALVGFCAFSFSTVSVSALNAAEKKECRKEHHGKSFDLTKPKQAENYEKFTKTKCSSSKGGNCKAQVTTGGGAIDDDGGRSPVHRASITCPLREVKPGGGKASSVDSVSDPALTAGGCTDADCTFIDAYVNPFIKLLSALVGVAAVIAIIVGGIQVTTSAGDPQKTARGKEHITNAIIGIVAYVLLFAVLNWVIPGGLV